MYTMESQFIALEIVGQEIEWSRPSWGTTILIFVHCDSEVAVGIAKNIVYIMAK